MQNNWLIEQNLGLASRPKTQNCPPQFPNICNHLKTHMEAHTHTHIDNLQSENSQNSSEFYLLECQLKKPKNSSEFYLLECQLKKPKILLNFISWSANLRNPKFLKILSLGVPTQETQNSSEFQYWLSCTLLNIQNISTF